METPQKYLCSFFSYFNNTCSSNPGHPFASGITLAKLAAVTMDEEGNETFDTSGALDKLRKVSFGFFPFYSQLGEAVEN